MYQCHFCPPTKQGLDDTWIFVTKCDTSFWPKIWTIKVDMRYFLMPTFYLRYRYWYYGSATVDTFWYYKHLSENFWWNLGDHTNRQLHVLVEVYCYIYAISQWNVLLSLYSDKTTKESSCWISAGSLKADGRVGLKPTCQTHKLVKPVWLSPLTPGTNTQPFWLSGLD